MAYVFRFPDVGEGLTEAEVVEWFVDRGSYVAADAALVAVETDKAQVEIPAPVAGFLLHRGAEEAEIVEVGAVLAVIGKEDEEWPAPSQPVSSAQDEVIAVAPSEDPPLVGTLDESAHLIEHEPLEATVASLPKLILEPPRALPLVRKFASDSGVDLHDVKGSGPSGRVTREDVEARLQLERGREREPEDQVQDQVEPEPEVEVQGRSDPEAQGQGQTQLQPQQQPKGQGQDSDLPERDAGGEKKAMRMSATRRAISANMTRSWSEIPHVTTFDEFDAEQLLRSRKALSRRHDTNIPLDAFIVAAVLPVLAELPGFNASLNGENLTLHSSVHAGVAINTERGLMVGVVHDAQVLGLRGISDRVKELAEKANANSLAASDFVGATFTVSNIRAAGGGFGTPLIPYGTTAILSVGAARDKPIVDQGEIVVAPMAPLSLSYDHRVIDGVTGRRFIELLKENLEEPTLFLV